MYLFEHKYDPGGLECKLSLLDTHKNPLPPQRSTLVSNISLRRRLFIRSCHLLYSRGVRMDVSTPSKVTVHDIEDSLESPQFLLAAQPRFSPNPTFIFLELWIENPRHLLHNSTTRGVFLPGDRVVHYRLIASWKKEIAWAEYLPSASRAWREG